MSTYTLSEKEKKESLRLFKIYDGNLLSVIRELWKDPREKGTTRRGRAVRTYWIEKGLQYGVKAHDPNKKPTPHSKDCISQEEKEFILKSYSPELSKEELAKIIWPDKKIVFTSTKFKEFSNFVDSNFDTSTDDLCTQPYRCPRELSALIKRINPVVFRDFDLNKISAQDKRCLEKLIHYLNAPRFVQVANSYPYKSDRNMFEAEYIRSTWDKPDLTNDELNLYVNVCIDFIKQKDINRQIQKLNKMFEDTEGQQELTVKLAEMIKTKNDEYNICSKRIESLINTLNGRRSDRLKNQKAKNASILNLVEMFQQEQERELMLRMAQMQKKAVYEEADRLESMSEWKARVLGISKHEAI